MKMSWTTPSTVSAASFSVDRETVELDYDHRIPVGVLVVKEPHSGRPRKTVGIYENTQMKHCPRGSDIGELSGNVSGNAIKLMPTDCPIRKTGKDQSVKVADARNGTHMCKKSRRGPYVCSPQPIELEKTDEQDLNIIAQQLNNKRKANSDVIESGSNEKCRARQPTQEFSSRRIIKNSALSKKSRSCDGASEGQYVPTDRNFFYAEENQGGLLLGNPANSTSTAEALRCFMANQNFLRNQLQPPTCLNLPNNDQQLLESLPIGSQLLQPNNRNQVPVVSKEQESIRNQKRTSNDHVQNRADNVVWPRYWIPPTYRSDYPVRYVQPHLPDSTYVSPSQTFNSVAFSALPLSMPLNAAILNVRAPQLNFMIPYRAAATVTGPVQFPFQDFCDPGRLERALYESYVVQHLLRFGLPRPMQPF